MATSWPKPGKFQFNSYQLNQCLKAGNGGKSRRLYPHQPLSGVRDLLQVVTVNREGYAQVNMSAGGRCDHWFRRSPLLPLEIITVLHLQVGDVFCIEHASMQHGKCALTSWVEWQILFFDVPMLTHWPAQLRSGSRALGESRCFPFSRSGSSAAEIM